MCTESAYKKFVDDTEVIERNGLFYLKNISNIAPYKTKEQALRVSEGLRNAIQF